MSVTFITSYLGQGLAAARPVSPNITAGSIGYYFATDTNALTVFAGGTWQAIPAASPTLPTGEILVGNASGIAAPVAMSGDAVITSAGVVTVSKSGGVAFGSAAFTSSAAYDMAGAAAAVQALRASTTVFGLAKVDGSTITAAAGVISAAQGSFLGPPFHPGYVAGRFYGSPGNQTASAAAASTGTLYFTPIYIGVAKTFTKMSVRTNASVVGTPHAEIGIYANNNGIPGALILDAGQVVLVSSGTSTISGLSLPLTAGWYWLAVSTDVSEQLFGIPLGINVFWQGQTAINGLNSGYSQAWAFSTGNLPVVGTLADVTGVCPSVWLSF